ncbi:MAG: xanthine dehydrogenase family protein subunit M [Burkholderiaceae bacterium]
MYPFTLNQATTLDQACQLAARGATVLAGGQTLLASMKLRMANPEQLVDLGRLKELSGIKLEGNNLRIGAMTKHQDVANSPDVQTTIPALAQLAGQIGDKQVRAMGTIGGSVANNDPAACYPSALLALGAVVHTNARTITAADFFQGLFSTALNPGELITAVSFPVPQNAAYMKFKQPASRFALVGVFVAQTHAGVRVAVTGAASGVFRHLDLEQALEQSFTVKAAASVTIDPTDLNNDLHASAAYRANLISVQTQRAVSLMLAS